MSNSSLFVPRRYVNVTSGTANVPLPVVKDISKLVKRGIHSSSTPGKDVNVHFSSQEDGGGLIDLSEYQVGPLPSIGMFVGFARGLSCTVGLSFYSSSFLIVLRLQMR